MDLQAVNLTKQWIERFVIGLRLCPFAHYSFYDDTIFYMLSDGKSMKEMEADLIELIDKLIAVTDDEISNAFVIYNAAFTFHEMLSLKENVDSEMEENGKSSKVQTVVFHPDFQFGDEDFEAHGNFTNRSPLPMIHVLRVDEVSKAIEMTENVDQIPFNNKRRLEMLRIKDVSEVFEDGFIDRIKKYI